MTPSCDYTLETVRIIIVTGLSGSGKSIAVRQLEDSGYYCVDNLPIGFLVSVVQSLAEHGHTRIAVSVDARSQINISDAGNAIEALKTRGCDVRMLFLTASTPELVQRFSETRRRHPLTLPRPDGTANMTLAEAIALERDKLAPAAELGHVIDTTGLAANTLRNWVRQFSEAEQSMMTLAFESFAFKHGLPVVADLVFDVRNLPNPYYDKALRPLTGLDAPIIKYLDNLPIVQDMVDDIARFIERWLPSYEAQNRHYLTVAIGCTGGQHRSVYVAQALAKRFAGKTVTVLRHRQLSRMGLGVSTEQTL